ncbi:RIP metalloprotease RseP [Candidatus Uabimicrobium sp. HlEnr_7]|uniref:RIP metalloprotease RseP n=1 Tax=Candidatus Uabimicrobium helgolandensis TaxID=3095367 RepID=UPI0035563DA3
MFFSILMIFLAAGLLSVVQGVLNWILVICGIGFLIFIHELGHFVVAKYEGVRVEAFALGFGNAIISKKWGETDYRINLIPLGGYVKMAGDLPEENTGRSDEFFSKTPGQRARILIAGVLMNALFGFIGMAIAFQVGSKFLVPKVGLVQSGSPAWEAGLEKGDIVLEVDGSKIYSFSDLFVEIAFSSPKGAVLKIKRDGEVKNITVFPKYDEVRGVSTIGIYPPMQTAMKVKEDTLTYKAGFRTGDVIVGVANGSLPATERKQIKVADGYEVERAISQMENSDLAITVKRDDQERIISITPQQYTVHRIGIRSRLLKIGNLKLDHNSPFQVGDTFVKVDGKRILNNEILENELALSQKERNFTVLRDDAEVVIPFTVKDAKTFINKMYFVSDLYIGQVMASYPARKVLKMGDKIIKMNGSVLGGWSDIYNAVQQSKGKPLTVTYVREGAPYTATLEAKKVDIPVLQLTHELTLIKSSSFLDSCRLGWIHTKNMAKHIFLMLKGLFSRKVSSKTLGGPVTIFAASHTYLELGMGRFIYFLALVSINLAIINLLPIPVLDGGHLILTAAEKINGKPLSQRTLIWINHAGFLFLLFLIIYVTANDIQRVFGG